MPFSFPRLVQPVLDKHCVSCHDGTAGPDKSELALTAEPAEQFTKSYQNLKPFVRWYEWGGASIEPIVTRPGRIGADESPLTKVLADAIHAPRLMLADSEMRRLYLWLDGNAPFYGAYDAETRLAQKSGHLVPPPALQ